MLWFLAFGALMVNTGLLPVEADAFISGLAELGIILIMFALGFEESTDNFIASAKRSWGIAFFGALAPFAAAYFMADYFWANTNTSIICGLTMTATAVSLTMVSLQSEGLHKSPVATRVMTSALLDDIASLALVAILVPIASGEGSANVKDIALIAAKAVGFFVLVTIFGAWVFPHEVKGWMKRVPLIGAYGFSHVITFSRHSTQTVLLLALSVGLLAHEFGFHPAIGAYMAGLIIHEEYFHLKGTEGSYADTKRIIDNVAFSWIGPVFFVELGTKLILERDTAMSLIPHILAMALIIFVAQVTSAALAARYTADMDWPGSVMIGFGMLGRAELAFVVMDIAYVQHAILSVEAFYTLMGTALILNVLVPLTIRLWKPVYMRTMPEGAGFRKSMGSQGA
ncbi:MAG: cation:proton antiporter [Proteobacteria bacterium]|nr:cation:proton antiporter [Pseudomonadota bacterium]